MRYAVLEGLLVVGSIPAVQVSGEGDALKQKAWVMREPEGSV
jgi:hypothetical protein